MSAPRPQSARAMGRSNINGVTQVDFQDAMQYEGSYPGESYAVDGYDTMEGSYGLGGGCDDVCCGDGMCDAGCCDGGGMCADGCSCGKSSGQRLSDACNCMRQRYDRWNGRATGFVNGVASGFCPHHVGYPEPPRFTPGPPTGQVAYPYYTVRGPRDFLQDNPPSIGPR